MLFIEDSHTAYECVNFNQLHKKWRVLKRGKIPVWSLHMSSHLWLLFTHSATTLLLLLSLNLCDNHITACWDLRVKSRMRTHPPYLKIHEVSWAHVVWILFAGCSLTFSLPTYTTRKPGFTPALSAMPPVVVLTTLLPSKVIPSGPWWQLHFWRWQWADDEPT